MSIERKGGHKPLDKRLGTDSLRGYVQEFLHEEREEGAEGHSTSAYKRVLEEQAKEIVGLKEEVARLEEEIDRLKDRTGKDSLTHFLNRQGYLEAIEERYGQASSDRRFTRTVFTFIDLDSFKDVNDRLGHARGDNVLVSVANAIKSQMHPEDILLRFGGDEFVAVWDLPADFSEDRIEEIIERKQRKLGIGVALAHSEGASFGSANMQSATLEDVGIPMGLGEDDEGGVLFQEAREKAYIDKEERRELARIGFGGRIDSRRLKYK